MTVLITGGAGYIGSHMVLDLLARGETPVVLDDLSTGFEWLLPTTVPLIRGDMADQALVAQGIERCPPEACAQVRILPRAHG